MSNTRKTIASILFILSIALAGAVAAVAYIASALATSLLIVNLTFAAIAFLAVCYITIRFLAGLLSLRQPRTWAWNASAGLTFLIVLLVIFPTLAERIRSYPDNTSETLLSDLRAKTLPLDTVQAGSGFEDLQPLKSIFANKRIVALGEASHGTSEFFQMKHRMLEFLVREMGFQHFGMELSAEDGQIINAYISGEPVAVRQILYWPWATAEVLEMLDWMRAYNADPASPHKLTFHGIDPRFGERDAGMAKNVTEILEQAGPESRIVLWAHNAHISNAPDWMGHALKQQWGEKAYLLGFEFNHGSFTSRMATVHVYNMEPASPDYYAYTLGKLEAPILLLDFKTMSQDADLQAWLAKPQRSHELQEIHAIYRLNPDWYTLNTSWLHLYDGVIYIEESTPARNFALPTSS